MFTAYGPKPPVKTYGEFFTESVYNLRPAIQSEVIRPPRHVCQYSDTVKKELRDAKRPRKTFGYAHTPLAGPTEYLHKRPRPDPCPPPAKPFDPCVELRETIPKKPDWNPIYRLPLSRDMIHKTKVKVLSIPTKEPVPKFVDTRHGDTMMLNPKSGLANDFVLKKSFGVVPKYIKRFEKSAIDRHNASLSAARGAELLAHQSKYRWLSEDERADILRKLKYNFDEAMHEFQALSVVLDNQTKIKRKTALEKTLNELEKTIFTVKSLKKIVIKLEPQDLYGP